MNAKTILVLVGQVFPSGTHVDFGRHNFIVHPGGYRAVNYDTLSLFVQSLEKSGGGRPRIDIETAPGEWGGSDVTPGDSDTVAFRVWMEVSP